MNDKKLFRLIEIAKALKPHNFDMRCYHTTFILFKNKIVSIGINSPKTHPKNLEFNYKSSEGVDIRKYVGVHSELAAILKYGKENTSNHVFVNIRINNLNKVCLAKPCSGCFSAIKQFGFKKIVFSQNGGNFGVISNQNIV